MEESLATELLHEVTMSARRWFIIAIIELVAIIGLTFFIFSAPVETAEETHYTQHVEDVSGSDISQRMETPDGEDDPNNH